MNFLLSILELKTNYFNSISSFITINLDHFNKKSIKKKYLKLFEIKIIKKQIYVQKSTNR